MTLFFGAVRGMRMNNVPSSITAKRTWTRLARLLPAMLPTLDFPRALIRGRYMAAVARMEFAGVPIDVNALTKIASGWEDIKVRLIEQIDKNYGVFDGKSFKAERWERWVADRGIVWPRLESGSLALDDDTFREMAKCHVEVSPMRELRASLSQLRLNELAVGKDGRNRCLLSPFGRSHRKESAEQQEVYFRPRRLAPWVDPTPPRHVRRLPRLRTTRVRNWGGVVGRQEHDGGVSVGRSVLVVCQASRALFLRMRRRNPMLLNGSGSRSAHSPLSTA